MTEKYDIIEPESKSYNKNKRQVYIWTENKEFFDNLRNKSKFVNLMIKKYRQEVGDITPDVTSPYQRECNNQNPETIGK